MPQERARTIFWRKSLLLRKNCLIKEIIIIKNDLICQLAEIDYSSFTGKIHIPGHSTPLTGLGAFILMTGFLGMVLGHGQNIELSATNIVLGGATSG